MVKNLCLKFIIVLLLLKEQQNNGLGRIEQLNIVQLYSS